MSKSILMIRSLDKCCTLLNKPCLLPWRVELVRKKEFSTAIPNLEDKTLTIYIVFITNLDLIHLFQKTLIVLLKVNEALIVVLPKYINFANLFSLVLLMELFE